MVVATRSIPRQRRSEESIDRLIDAAERVIDRVGAGATTTALVAAEAGVSVGRVYYWFPHIEALLETVARRASEHLAAQMNASVRPPGEVSIDVAVVRLVDEVTAAAWAHPGVVALLLDPGVITIHGAAPLRSSLIEAVNILLTAHIPAIDAAEAHRVSIIVVEMMVGAAAASVIADPVEGSALEREVAYAVCAYLATRFPPPGDVLWLDPTHPVRPARSASTRGWSRDVLGPSPD